MLIHPRRKCFQTTTFNFIRIDHHLYQYYRVRIRNEISEFHDTN